MLGLLASILALIAMGLGGVAVLRRYAPGLTPLEIVAYGLPLGVIAATLATLALATVVGLSWPLVVAVSVASLVAAWAVLLDREASNNEPADRWAAWRTLTPAKVALLVRERVGLLPLIVLAGLLIRWIWAWKDAFTYTRTGLAAHQLNVWGDWALHLGDVTSFAYGDNFLPENPRFAGTPYPYHFLADLTAAMIVKLGVDPAYSLGLHTFLFSVLMALALFAFARRVTGSNLAGGLSVFLFLLGGGLGWLFTLRDINTSHNFADTLRHHAWDFQRHQAGLFRWENVYDSLISIQRGYLYGLPLALLGLTLLMIAVEGRDWRPFLTAGIVLGLLPFAHQSTLLALAFVTPFLLLLFPRWEWAIFYAAWIGVAVPQLLVQLGGGRGAIAAAHWQPWWVAAPDPWPWFWVKNLGLYLPLALIALGSRSLLPRTGQRFLWAFMPLFAAFNLAIFQPWDWDNNKLLLYWFLAVAILVAALLARTWREQRAVATRFLIIAAIATMTLSGLLLNLFQLTSRDSYELLNNEDIALAQQIRDRTSPHAIFAAGLQHNHPVHVLGGRRVMVGYNGWLWVHGIDTRQREKDLQAIFTYGPDAPALIRQYNVSYLVIGPGELSAFKPNEAAIRAAYPLAISTEHYHIYRVDGGGQ